MLLYDFLAGIAVGLLGGVTSGLLGVSPGGGLVVFSVLLLGSEQHAAQGISLVAQIPPTSAAGVRRYWEKGSRSPLRWVVLLAIGFLAGGIGGALAAVNISASVLRWTYVLYLTALTVLLVVRPPSRQPAAGVDGWGHADLHWPALVAVGAIAGFSSGFMGIGGGLAITAGLSAGLKVPQHQAQVVSLVLSIIPMTIPAAWIYWQQGWSIPWLVVVGVILGLWGGTDLGARMANGVGERTLRRLLIALVCAMTVYMTYKALR